MLLLLPLPFIVLGCFSFCCFANIAQTRRFALGSALWLAAFGGFLPAAAILALLLAVGTPTLSEHLHSNLRSNFAAGPHRMAIITAAVIIVLTSATGASAVAILHGIIVRRLTYSLFRLYVTAVACGVSIPFGLYWGSLLAYRLKLNDTSFAVVTYLWTLCCVIGMIWQTYSNAQDFRSHRPDTLNPIAPEEYGPAESATR
jgi:hypothetical protein